MTRTGRKTRGKSAQVLLGLALLCAASVTAAADPRAAAQAIANDLGQQ